MKTIHKSVILFAVLLCSCNGPASTSDEEFFMQKDGVCMVVGTKEYLNNSKTPLQTSYNSDKHIYRAGIPVVKRDSKTGLDVEIVQEYFVLVLEAAPGAEGSEVKGSLYLMSSELSSGSQKYIDVSFTVKRISSELVWLWSSDKHIGVVIQVL